MALKRVLSREDYNKLSDALKEHYVVPENDEAAPATLDVTLEPDEIIGNSKKIKGALDAERRLKSAAEAALKDYKKFGDVASLEATLQELEALKAAANDPDHKKRLETLEAQLVKKYEAQSKQLSSKYEEQIKALNDTTKGLETQLSNELVTSRARAAINKHKGREPAILPAILQVARVVPDERDSTKRIVHILDTDGQPRLSQRSKDGTTLMDVDEFVESLKADSNFAPLFDGVQASGSGTNGTNRPGSSKGPHTISEIDAADVMKYRAARAAAEKAGVPLQVV